jgi:RHS repeat-associated protein
LSGYAATRSGTGAWNDNRNFQYNSRNQLTKEPIGLSGNVLATNNYSFDPYKLGVLTNAQWSGGLTNRWQGTLNSLDQIASETWGESNLTLRANGSALNAFSVSAKLDGNSISTVLAGGRWYSDLALLPGNHTLAASAVYAGSSTGSAVTNSFTVVGTNTVIDYYDGAGNLTNRVFANGKIQFLVWDGFGRLVSVVQRDNPTNGFNWTAIYDCLGRRLRTIQTPVINGVTNNGLTLTLDSYYDPQVEYQELAVAVNGQRTWKVMGPDINGRYGGVQGVGGLEATVRESDGLTTPVLNDYFGNVLATFSSSTVNWNPVRASGYGPVIGYQAPTLSLSTPLTDSLLWRSRRMDPSGFYYMGARYYDPVAGHFISPDPLGHTSTMDLYSAFNGDPINFFDPNAWAVIQAWQQTQQNLINSGGFWNNAAAYGVSFGITAFNAFSLGTFSKNDALADRNISGEISDAKFYGGMAVNSGVALASVAAGYGTGAIVSGAFRGTASFGSYVLAGSASGLTSSTMDVVGTRLGYASIGVKYQQTVGQDLTEIGLSTGFGGLFGGITYGLQSSPFFRVGNSPNTVISGHGEIAPGDITIPDGTTLRTFSLKGDAITDELGNAIETGQDLSGIDINIYGPGSKAPNLILHPPTGLTIAGDPIVLSPGAAGAPLSRILYPNMGTVDWACCQVYQGMPPFGVAGFNMFPIVSSLGAGSFGTATSFSTSSPAGDDGSSSSYTAPLGIKWH